MNIGKILRVVGADWRRLLWVSLLGWPGVALALGFTWMDLARSLDQGEPLMPARVAKLLSPLYLGQMPLMIWTAAFMYGETSRQRLTDSLPLSLRELNVSRILSGLVLLSVGMIPWLVAFAVWRRFDAPFSPWLLLFAGLFFVSYLFLSMRQIVVRAVPHLLIVIMWGAEILLDLSVELGPVPWICGLLAVLAIVYGWRAVTQPPPRWAR
jgi:hypothetical protein